MLKFIKKTFLGNNPVRLFVRLLTLTILLYLLILPVYPELRYELSPKKEERSVSAKEPLQVRQEAEKMINRLPEAEYSVSSDRLIITKIGVNAPIIRSQDESALDKGVWLLSDSSTPGQVGNTVITGHRFKYLPPHNLTFYLFHKLEPEDLVYIIWNQEEYLYLITEVRVVDRTDLSILESGSEEILTLFTCHPLYSTSHRLVLVAEPVD